MNSQHFEAIRKTPGSESGLTWKSGFESRITSEAIRKTPGSEPGLTWKSGFESWITFGWGETPWPRFMLSEHILMVAVVILQTKTLMSMTHKTLQRVRFLVASATRNSSSGRRCHVTCELIQVSVRSPARCASARSRNTVNWRNTCSATPATCRTPVRSAPRSSSTSRDSPFTWELIQVSGRLPARCVSDISPWLVTCVSTCCGTGVPARWPVRTAASADQTIWIDTCRCTRKTTSSWNLMMWAVC